ncbi:MAG: small ribosomal subunit Rsm22 family protein [Phenylobacterium sp.]|uniref:small ribosomal subunit Rsm22 family protein n=1 Tax=Phenylobacterium sp. TaxID=1871053 RepID=UPI00391B39DE
MGPELPAALRAAVEALLEGASRKDLARRSAQVSNTYRGGGSSATAIVEDADATAYVLSRLPATYAAVAAALDEVRVAAPDFAPASLLDAGAGPGGASWAALEAWPRIAEARLLDASPVFLETARRLAAAGPAALAGAEMRRGDLTQPGEGWRAADLVVTSYALAEIPSERLEAAVRGLWAACAGVLVIVEPGTPAGTARVLAARELAMREGAMVLAPCAHQQACPLAAPDWCHFAQRLPRGRDHRLAKGADAPFEDEKHAYVALARPDVCRAAPAARVLSPPRAGKPGLEFRLCTPGGIERRFVARRDRAAYAAHRRLRWGDRVEDA